MRAPFSAAAAAAKIAGALDSSHFGECWPSAADWTISFQPVCRCRELPMAVARLQKRHWHQRRDGLKRLGLCTKSQGALLEIIAILAQRGFEQVENIQLRLSCPF